MTEPTDAPRPGFEASLDRLEEIVRTLESGEMPLEEALEVFEEGVRLSRFCHKLLSQAERRVEILLRNEEGEIESRPFESDSRRESD
jgi:exodeoxyribonuclease VII small subunit